MNVYKLIYFRGCPNYEPAKILLQQAKIDFLEVCQDELEKSDPLLMFSSPTLLKGKEVIFGSRTNSSSGGCSLSLPSLEQLLKRLL